MRGGLLRKLGEDDAKNQQNPVDHATGIKPLSKPEVKGDKPPSVGTKHSRYMRYASVLP